MNLRSAHQPKLKTLTLTIPYIGPNWTFEDAYTVSYILLSNICTFDFSLSSPHYTTGLFEMVHNIMIDTARTAVDFNWCNKMENEPGTCKSTRNGSEYFISFSSAGVSRNSSIDSHEFESWMYMYGSSILLDWWDN